VSEQRITIIDLARAAGVSKMTVSRALRGERGISAETQHRIRAIAEKLGYHPDPAVSQLMGRLRRSKTTTLEPLAWLTTYPTLGGWRSNPGTNEMFQGATEQARRLGYRLEEFSLRTPGMTARRMSSILYHQGIRGIVLAPLLVHGNIDGFAWQHFATVCCGHSLLNPALHRVSVDQYDVFRLAWKQLAARGYQRIGLCVSANDNQRIGRRWEAALAVETASLPPGDRVPPMLTDDWTLATFRRWYETARPDVVLSFIDGWNWLNKIGVRIPDECGFALLRMDGGDNIAGVDHRFSDIGGAAVSLLVGELATNRYGIPRIRSSVSIECHCRDGPTIIGPSHASLHRV
jgi:LacI family transcriptional regulator